MSWEQLEQKHQKQMEAFEILKDAAYQKMQKSHAAMYDSFSNKMDEIPDSVRERVQEDHDKFNQEWGRDGSKMRELRSAQESEKKDYNKRHNDFKQQLRNYRDNAHDITKNKNNGQGEGIE